jgi:hypothetical protein
VRRICVFCGSSPGRRPAFAAAAWELGARLAAERIGLAYGGGSIGLMLFEAITWGQLGIHRKPIGLLDVEGYFAPLLAFVERAVGDGFIRPPYRELFVVSATVDGLLAALARHVPPPPIVSWIRPDES